MNKRMKNFRLIRNSAIIRNPLLLEAIGLCPVVAIATTLKSAVFLALVTTVELVVCEFLASKFLKKVSRSWRVAIYFLVGAVIVLPIMYLVNRFVPILSLELGVFLPLMAVNSLLALHCERVAVKRTVKDSLLDAVSVSVSYGAVTIITGLLREFLGYGTVGGINVHMPVTFPVMLMPFGGLLILGFSAAFLKSYIYRKYPKSSPDKAFDTSEVRQSLSGSLRELMSDDFNPYDEGGDIGISENTNAPEKEKTLKPETDKPKKDKPKKEKLKKEKIKKEKKVKRKDSQAEKKAPDIKTNEIPKSEERTYLDDFSDMLSDLESYKAQRNTEDENESEGDE